MATRYSSSMRSFGTPTIMGSTPFRVAGRPRPPVVADRRRVVIFHSPTAGPTPGPPKGPGRLLAPASRACHRTGPSLDAVRSSRWETERRQLARSGNGSRPSSTPMAGAPTNGAIAGGDVRGRRSAVFPPRPARVRHLHHGRQAWDDTEESADRWSRALFLSFSTGISVVLHRGTWIHVSVNAYLHANTPGNSAIP